jgi:hypothetical protein
MSASAETIPRVTIAQLAPLFLRQRPVFLLMDGCSSHTHRNVIVTALTYGICPIFPPANCTAWLQPVDNHLNAYFNKVFKDCLPSRCWKCHAEKPICTRQRWRMGRRGT